MDRWCEDVLRELDLLKETLPAPSAFSTIYAGGGTPSFLPLPLWKKLGKALAGLPKTAEAEFTVEANPDSLSLDKLKLWKECGVNRISLGIQSLDDGELKCIARPHSALQALHALDLCMNEGFRASGDLIFGLPGQTMRRWHASLSGLLRQGLEHLSVYQLMIEPDSFWGRHRPAGLPDGYGMYRWAQYYLPRKGLKQYEIASFAVPGQESRHNCAYWRRKNVCALGPAAWGFRDGTRFANSGDFERWASCVESGQSPVDFEERLTGGEEVSEAAILALRMSTGIELRSFSERYGESWLKEILRRLQDLPQDDLQWSEGRVALSPRGMRVGNSIWAELMDLDRPKGTL